MQLIFSIPQTSPVDRAEMLMLCLATAALKLSRPPSLSRAEVDDLVAQRTRLRSLRDFAAADAVKDSLESAGVRLQDEVSGCAGTGVLHTVRA